TGDGDGAERIVGARGVLIPRSRTFELAATVGSLRAALRNDGLQWSPRCLSHHHDRQPALLYPLRRARSTRHCEFGTRAADHFSRAPGRAPGLLNVKDPGRDETDGNRLRLVLPGADGGEDRFVAAGDSFDHLDA